MTAMTIRPSPGRLTIGVLIGLALAMGRAQAAAEEAKDTMLGEIVVTAQKRAESIQDIPVSVSAFSGEQLHALGISQAADLASQVPGLFSKTTLGDSAPTFTIRGIGLNDFVSNNNSPTSIYLDDVYQPFHPMVSFALFDMARVEVLKGPQGTLYGRNNTGGAIKFVAQRPTSDTSSSARLSYGRFQQFEAEAALGGALSEHLNGRVALFTRQGGGYQKDRLTGREMGDANRLAARVMLDWQASDSLSVLLNLHGGRDKGENQQFKLANSQNPANTFVPCAAAMAGIRTYDGSCTDLIGFTDPSSDRYLVSGHNGGFPEGPRRDNHGYGASLTADWRLGRVTLTSVSGYDRFDRSEGIDADGQPGFLADGRYDDSMHAFSQELRLTSDDSWSVKWIGGAFYSRDSIHVLQRLQSNDFLPIVTGLPPPLAAWQDFEQKTESFAGFGQVEWPLAEKLTLVTGLRYTNERKNFSGGSTFVSDLLGRIPLASTVDSITANDLSGKIGLNYKPSSELLLYVSASKGFKSGGFNAAFASSPIQLAPFNPEKLWAYEAGWKSTLLDHQLTFNGSVYYYDWRSFQAQVVTVNGGVPIQILSNAGDAEIKGAELEFNWQPSRKISGNLALNFTDSSIKKGQLKGQPVANTPKFAASAYFRYTQPMGRLSGFAQADYNYRSKVNFRLNAVTGLSQQQGYGLAGIRLGLATPDDRSSLEVAVRNISDKAYLVDAFEQLPINILDVWGAPRQWSVSLSHRFQ
jgi:iron complex outermembrane recepter protein